MPSSQVHTARGLPKKEDRGAGDPYVVAYFTGTDYKLMTTTVRNNVESPFFGEDLTFVADAVGETEDLEAFESIHVEMWDQDGPVAKPVEGKDSFLGACDIPILSAPSTSSSFKLEGGSSSPSTYVELSFHKGRENDAHHRSRVPITTEGDGPPQPPKQAHTHTHTGTPTEPPRPPLWREMPRCPIRLAHQKPPLRAGRPCCILRVVRRGSWAYGW